MSNNHVHWGEGLFLRPHHFQMVERHLQGLVYLSESWNVGYAYGLRRIEIDHDSLTNWRLSLSACDIRLQDGSHIRVPEDASLAPILIPKDAFSNTEQRALVHLVLPRMQMGLRNVTAGDESTCRYVVDVVEAEDENSPGNPQRIEIRRPQVRLMIGKKEDVTGYDALPILRLRLGSAADSFPEIDPDYIPPILACDAWPLLKQLITGIYDYLGGASEREAQQMLDHGVSFESGGRSDLELILKLQSINASLGALQQIAFSRGVHPFIAYAELCRIVGMGAIFHHDRKMPELPLYDHDDLGTCFRAIRAHLIPEVRPASYIKRPFIGDGLQMRVRLERDWLDSSWMFYIGVHSSLSFSEVQALLDRRSPAYIDFKMGASEEVDIRYRDAREGVSFTPEPDPPKIFPHANWAYFRVDRTSQPWTKVEETLNLAIRFNERLVVGKIDREEKLVLQHPTTGKTIGVSFAIFAMPTKS
jgi:type VI secretion system protein ImpJ